MTVSSQRAAAMSLMERLEPDEQLAAKVASVFPVAFTWFEVQAVYPRPMSPRSFQQMIENLIAKEMLESCEPPSQPQLEELDLLPLQRGEKRESVNGPGTSNDKYTPFLNWNQEKGDYPESLNPPDDDNSTKKMRSVATEEFSGSNESTVEESLVTELALPANRWGFDDDGNPIFYRFTSIAFQHVVADLLMSQEREFLARVSRKVICFRRTYGLEFLIQQIHAKPVDKSIIGGLGDQQETAQDALYSLSWNPTVEDIPKDSAYPVSVHPLQSMKTPFKLSQSMLTRHSSGNQQNTNTKMIDTNNKTLPTDSFRPYNDACTRSMVNTPDADTLTTLGDRHDSAKGTTSNSTD